MRILVAEDDPVTREAIAACLEAEGYTLRLAGDGREALDLWRKEGADLLCLDVMMPEVDGYEVCRKVRAENPRVPVLFLSAKNEEVDVVVGLELGADDFVRKPFGRRELTARVKTALRRRPHEPDSGAKSSSVFSMGTLTVYPKELRAEKGGDEIELTVREAEILELLHERRGEAVSRDALLDRCWGVDYFPESRTLDQHIANLRKKIEDDPARPAIVETVRGVGYRFR